MRGPGINPDVVAVEVVNLSRRVVTADTVGFWDPEVRQLTLIDQPHLPCRLQPGGKLIAFGSVQEFVPLLAVNRRLVPVCTDSEGQRHLGKRDSSLTNHNAAAQNNSTLVGEGQQRETHT